MKHTFSLLCIILFIFTTTLPGQTWDGYILSGRTMSYIHGGLNDSDFLVYKVDLNGAKQWRKNYGGAFRESGGHIQKTTEGGYIIAGYTNDFLVYKLDANGRKQWRNYYGGSLHEQRGHAYQAADGGYIICGDSTSYTHGSYDLLVYKIDATGAVEWRKNYGGISHEWGTDIHPISDGGYMLIGHSSTYTNDRSDILVYKINSDGHKRWRRNYGGMGIEWNGNIRETIDGGCILTGYTTSYGEGKYDLVVYKLNGDGAKQWRKNFGGDGSDYGGHIEQTADGGYILAGYGDSFTNGYYDMLVYKLNANGAKQWRKNYGGVNGETAAYIQQTPDGGYILGGTGTSYSNGETDFLIYKLDASGNKQWRRNYGGILGEELKTVEPTFH